MGRYKVAADVARQPDPAAMVLVPLAADRQSRRRPASSCRLSKLIGIEPATKLVVMSIPPLTVAGMLWVAREVHNRLPPTVAFALPLAFGHPFMFGFVNFALSMALALLAFGLWLRLGRLGKIEASRHPVRADQLHRLFRPYLRLGHARPALLLGRGRAPARPRAAAGGWRSSAPPIHAAAMALPVLLIILWRSEATGGLTHRWFDWDYKWEYLLRMFRDRWEAFDIASAGDRAGGPGLRADPSPPDPVAQPRLFGAGAGGQLCAAAAHRVRIGLCRHAAGAVRGGDLRPGDPLQGRKRASRWRPGWRLRRSASCSSAWPERRPAWRSPETARPSSSRRSTMS